MTDDEKQKFLLEEYKILWQRWDDFDRRALSIKGWTTAALAIFIALGRNAPVHMILFLLSFTISIWILEAIWKTWQHANGQRIRAIEKSFSSQNFKNINPLQIDDSWTRSYEMENSERLNLGKITHELFRPFVMFPYIIFIIYILIILGISICKSGLA